MIHLRNTFSIRRLGLLLGLISMSLFSQDISRAEYISRYKDLAISKMKSHGIPASITLAQGCLESANGNSVLALKAKNHFGIKCHKDWKGPSIRRDDDAKNECFRKYSKVLHSYEDHGDFLRYNKRYAFLFDLKPTDYKGWAYGLKQAGYATNPRYPELLIKIIEENELYHYDKGHIPFIVDKVSVPPPPREVRGHKAYTIRKFSPYTRIAKSREVYTTNKVPYIIAKEGDTYKKIAREANLFTRELLDFNDRKGQKAPAPGEKVYLNMKKNKAPRGNKVHITEAGETYWEISQLYGVKLKKIYQYNDIDKKQKSPSAGQELFIRDYKGYYWRW